jgi:D-glycero-D-manno-heptose 1,7-bisphosphate phosphatase
VNAGLHILSKELLSQARSVTSIETKEKIDLDRDILKPMLETKRIFAYNTPEYIKDMGTPERYRQCEADIRGGIVAARSLRAKQRAVFLDRDGTINIDAGFITRPEDFTLIDGAAQAIKHLNDAGYLVIVVTNQPVIARGACTVETLELIHQKMETLLGKEGACLDAVFYCPHHPDRGFAGEIPALKIECDCRKPKPGMIFAAAKKYNIDTAQSWMIGDSERDIRAGKAASCKTVFLTGGKTGSGNFDSDIVCASLAEFVALRFSGGTI